MEEKFMKEAGTTNAAELLKKLEKKSVNESKKSSSHNAYEVLSLLDVNFDLLVRNIVKNKAKKTELDNVVDLHIMGIGNKDPLIGRENELHQLINALSRRNKPNAILVGEPGVGKTAIVEELASLIYKGEVHSLKGKRIYELDMASTISGT